MPAAYKGPGADISWPRILGNVIREIKVERDGQRMLIIFSAKRARARAPMVTRPKLRRSSRQLPPARVLRVERGGHRSDAAAADDEEEMRFAENLCALLSNFWHL